MRNEINNNKGKTAGRWVKAQNRQHTCDPGQLWQKLFVSSSLFLIIFNTKLAGAETCIMYVGIYNIHMYVHTYKHIYIYIFIKLPHIAQKKEKRVKRTQTETKEKFICESCSSGICL